MLKTKLYHMNTIKTKSLLQNLIILILFLCISSYGMCQGDTDYNSLKLWYNKAAGNWNQALPIGNGKLGAMVFGRVENERIQLNEESIWTGSQVQRANPEAKKNLNKIRKLLFDRKYAEADKLAQEKIMGTRLVQGVHTYQTLGNLNFEFKKHESFSDYYRELDLERAVVKVSYKIGKIAYKREIFSSAPDNSLVINIEASEPGALSFDLTFSRPGDIAKIDVNNNEIHLYEQIGNGNGVKLHSILKVRIVGGDIWQENQILKIENADKVNIFVVAATDYNNEDPYSKCREYIAKVWDKPIKKVISDHILDYKSLFNRVKLDLGYTDAIYFPVDQRIDALKRGAEDPHLINLYYQFGRYLLISSSRPGSLPANLQGIWAEGLKPPWNADYHININIQMNYWPAEVTNLSECHLPFFDFVEELVPRGKITAKDTYGCRGFVAHHTTDLWRYADAIGRTGYGMWPMGAAWCSDHFWEHYLFTKDENFLSERAYPVLKEAALFFVDFLVEDQSSGYLVSGPSISPENRFITDDGQKSSLCMGPAMDHQIIRELFSNTIKASKILNIDNKFRKKLIKKLERLAPVKIGSDGRILEWSEELREAEPGHRHMSHLYGLHPGNQFTFQNTPELINAAKKSIEYRLSNGGGHTGWSRAWIINFFARLQNGNRAYENVLAIIRKSTLSNLFDNHPPFQIDGNFGAVSGISEMLLQSQAGEIHILPALPDAWADGSIEGLKARGGFEINIAWENSELKSLRIYSHLGGPCKVRYKDRLKEINIEKGKFIYLNF